MKCLGVIIACAGIWFAQFPMISFAGMQEGIEAYKANDYKVAYDNFYIEAINGDYIAQFQLGAMYLGGVGIPQNISEAKRWLKSSADQNYAFAQYLLGTLYEGGLDGYKDPESAFKYFKASAEQGNEDAAFSLGQSYLEGLGTEINIAEAVKWLTFSANKGNMHALNNLAVLYMQGTGVQKDNVKAFALIYKAANLGLIKAYSTLGKMYAEGKGTAVDYLEARKWIEEGVAKEDVDCMNAMGWLYENGYGFPQDFKKALNFYKMASTSKSRYFIGIRNIGLLYKSGKLGTADPFMAYIHFNLSAKDGQLYDSLLRDEEAKKLSPKEILLAQDVTSKWVVGAELKDPRLKSLKATKQKRSVS